MKVSSDVMRVSRDTLAYPPPFTKSKGKTLKVYNSQIALTREVSHYGSTPLFIDARRWGVPEGVMCHPDTPLVTLGR